MMTKDQLFKTSYTCVCVCNVKRYRLVKAVISQDGLTTAYRLGNAFQLSESLQERSVIVLTKAHILWLYYTIAVVIGF